MTVSTYQSVTGTGAAAREELLVQSREMLAGEAMSPPSQYPHPIAFNLLPQVDDFMEEGYTKEEWKMVNESRKILHDSELRLASTCVRVPVEVSHCESVTVEFDDPISVDEARLTIAEFARHHPSGSTARFRVPNAVQLCWCRPSDGRSDPARYRARKRRRLLARRRQPAKRRRTQRAADNGRMRQTRLRETSRRRRSLNPATPDGWIACSDGISSVM